MCPLLATTLLGVLDSWSGTSDAKTTYYTMFDQMFVTTGQLSSANKVAQLQPISTKL